MTNRIERMNVSMRRLSRLRLRQASFSTGEGGVPSTSSAQNLARLTGEFNHDATATAEKVASALTPAQRVLLASALREQIKPEHMNEAYFDALWTASTDKGQMTE